MIWFSVIYIKYSIQIHCCRGLFNGTEGSKYIFFIQLRLNNNNLFLFIYIYIIVFYYIKLVILVLIKHLTFPFIFKKIAGIPLSHNYPVNSLYIDGLFIIMYSFILLIHYFKIHRMGIIFMKMLWYFICSTLRFFVNPKCKSLLHCICS
jgi:hypothetical protein